METKPDNNNNTKIAILYIYPTAYFKGRIIVKKIAASITPQLSSCNIIGAYLPLMSMCKLIMQTVHNWRMHRIKSQLDITTSHLNQGCGIRAIFGLLKSESIKNYLWNDFTTKISTQNMECSVCMLEPLATKYLCCMSDKFCSTFMAHWFCEIIY